MQEYKELQVLLIEDNPGDARLIQELLSEATNCFFHIQVAQELQEGIQIGLQHQPDVVLLDLSLPDSHGLATFFQFYEQLPHLPIILLTGMDDEQAALIAVQGGAQDYLSKDSITAKSLPRALLYAVNRNQLEEQGRLQILAMESTANIVFITNANGVIEWVNQAFTKTMGYSAQEAIGNTPHILNSGAHPSEFFQSMWKEIKKGNVVKTEVINRRKDSRLITLEQTVTPFSDRAGQITNFVAIQQDISVRKQAEKEKKRRLRELEALQQVSWAMRNAVQLKDILPILLNEVLTALDVSSGAIWMYDAQTQILHEAVSRGWFQKFQGEEMKPNDGIGGTVFTTGQTYHVADFSLPNNLSPKFAKLIPTGWGGACLPLRTKKETAGVLFLSTQLPRILEDDEIQLIESMTEIVGGTMDRLKLLDEIRQQAKRTEILNQVGRILTESLDLQEIYQRLQQTICELIPEISMVMFTDYMHETDTFNPVFAYKNQTNIPKSSLYSIPQHVNGTRALVAQAIHIRKPVIQKTQPEITLVSNGQPMETTSLHTKIVIPMLVQERPVGTIILQSLKEAVFTPYWVELLEVIGNTAAIVVENARLFAETQQRLERINSLRTIDIAISSDKGLDHTLSVLLNQVITCLQVDAANVLIYNPAQNHFRYAGGQGFHTTALQKTTLPMGHGYAGQAAKNRVPLEVRDLQTGAHKFSSSPEFAAEGFEVYFGVPLIAKGDIQGVLEVFFRSSFAADQEWLLFLEALAGQGAIAIENATLFQNLEQSNTNLLLAYDATIEGWSKALDFRDHETENHSQRVTEMTYTLAASTGLFSDDELIHVRWGALLHDIGKLGVPDSILLKPDTLTDDEWTIMRKHPELAYEMLNQIEYLKASLEIPLSHHERWDGTGYPHGLKETEIPLAARIFAIADVYDALISDRPYRQAWPKEQAVQYIIDQAGKHFDPDLIPVFLQLINR